MTGEADALLHMKTASPAELEAIVEQVRAHQNAERTKTTIVLSRVVDRTAPADQARSTRPWRCIVREIACSRTPARQLDASRRR